MKRDTLILVVALVCGVAAFGLIFNFLKQAAAPKNQFVTARQALQKGKILDAEDLTISPPLKNIPAQSYFTQLVDVIGMELQSNLAKGKLIARTQVKKVKAPPPVLQTEGGVEAMPVPANMRALTLNANEIENVPKLLSPGSYVDILGTVIFGNNQREIRTILRGMQVVWVQMNEKKQFESITLAIPPPQVETLVNAMKYGKLRLVGSSEAEDNSSVWSTVASIEIIRGTQKERKVS